MRKLMMTLLTIVLLCGMISACSPAQTGQEPSQNPFGDITQEQESESISSDLKETLKNYLESEGALQSETPYETVSFQLTMLDVGQGLSLLIEADGHTMIYDGAGRDYASYVVSYLDKHGIHELDYLFASHYDEDHINGLVGILNTTKVDLAVTPDYEADSKIYQSFRKMMNEKQVAEEHPTPGTTYSLGNATIQVLGPKDYLYEDANNNSIVIKVSYGEFSCLITGDAEKEAELDLTKTDFDLISDVLVVGHHGSASSTSDNLVFFASPNEALISVGEDNSYGHPSDKTLQTLQDKDVSIYRTDLNGEIVVTSDGKTYEIHTENPTHDNSESVETLTEDITYILNSSSLKFHMPDCSSVEKMSPSNKVLSDKTREELLQEGYSPCGYCKP